MSKGRADVRQSKRDGKFRMRFYGLDEERLDCIQSAVAIARKESDTEYDSVALDQICVHFLATYFPDC